MLLLPSSFPVRLPRFLSIHRHRSEPPPLLPPASPQPAIEQLIYFAAEAGDDAQLEALLPSAGADAVNWRNAQRARDPLR